ncbi:hypothetical protein GCK32_007611 [Trichostrongylus colubriformis]|uniref:GRHL1/CP2 C-terminal domain-containing protein n=1 Tax=Trichostrongylus colubriformis TaxID=6319 RepID=A0AAN8IPM1_TRICO
MSILTPDQLIEMGIEKTHAFCIYSTLKARNEGSNQDTMGKPAESRDLNIYVNTQLTNFGGELVYKMVHLQSKTKDELYKALQNCDAIRRCGRIRMFYVGPAGIKVEMSDEVVSLWKNESTFAISLVNGVYHIQLMSR